MTGFGAFFGGMGGMLGGQKKPAANQPGGQNFVGPMPQQSGGQKFVGAMGQFKQDGGEGLPGLTAISKGLGEHQFLKNQGRVLHTQMQLNRRTSMAAQRQMIGKQVSLTGASGLKQEGSTLDLINQTNLEFELDQAILKHSYRLQRDALDRAGDQARMQGIMKGAKELAGFGMSF